MLVTGLWDSDTSLEIADLSPYVSSELQNCLHNDAAIAAADDDSNCNDTEDGECIDEDWGRRGGKGEDDPTHSEARSSHCCQSSARLPPDDFRDCGKVMMKAKNTKTRIPM